MSTGTSSSTESSSDDDGNETPALDLGNSDATSDGSSSDGDASSTSTFEDLDASSSSEGAGGAQPCCEAAMEPGCADPELEACVCAADDFCCLEQWDAACVDVAKFGNCGAVCAENPIVPEPGECCTPNPQGPGCDDPQVQDCVCAVDPYCCAYTWDDLCVDYVEQHECGVCE